MKRLGNSKVNLIDYLLVNIDYFPTIFKENRSNIHYSLWYTFKIRW